MRFATAELLELKTLAANAEAAYVHMDTSYKQLSAVARKRKVPPLIASEERKQQLEAETTGEGAQSKDEEEGKVSVASGLDMESYTAPSAAQVLASLEGGSDGGAALAPDDGDADNAESEDPVVAEVLAFHATADAYCAAFRALASDFVGRKQKEVPEGGGEVCWAHETRNWNSYTVLKQNYMKI